MYFTFSTKKIYATSIAIFLLFLVLGAVQICFANRFILVGNEKSHVILIDSVVNHRKFVIDVDPSQTDVSFYQGEFYSNKPPGFAFFVSPFYYLLIKVFGLTGEYEALIFIKCFNIILSSLSVILMYFFLSTFKFTKFNLFFGLIAATFGTIFFAYNSLAISFPLSLFLVMMAILYLRLFQINNSRSSFLAISLFAAIYAVTVDYTNAFFLLPVIVYAAVKMRKKIPLLLISLTPAFLLFYYNYLVFENPFTISYSHYLPPGYIEWPGANNSLALAFLPGGLGGLLFSLSRGLFIISPVTLLGVMALWNFLRGKRQDLLLIASTAITQILFIASYIYWHGGHSVGYRHILLSAIMLGMISSFCLEKYKKITVIAVIILIFSGFTGVMSFFIQIDQSLLLKTWEEEPKDIHANYYIELLYPLFTGKR